MALSQFTQISSVLTESQKATTGICTFLVKSVILARSTPVTFDPLPCTCRLATHYFNDIHGDVHRAWKEFLDLKGIDCFTTN